MLLNCASKWRLPCLRQLLVSYRYKSLHSAIFFSPKMVGFNGVFARSCSIRTAPSNSKSCLIAFAWSRNSGSSFTNKKSWSIAPTRTTSWCCWICSVRYRKTRLGVSCLPFGLIWRPETQRTCSRLLIGLQRLHSWQKSGWVLRLPRRKKSQSCTYYKGHPKRRINLSGLSLLHWCSSCYRN